MRGGGSDSVERSICWVIGSFLSHASFLLCGNRPALREWIDTCFDRLDRGSSPPYVPLARLSKFISPQWPSGYGDVDTWAFPPVTASREGRWRDWSYPCEARTQGRGQIFRDRCEAAPTYKPLLVLCTFCVKRWVNSLLFARWLHPEATPISKSCKSPSVKVFPVPASKKLKFALDVLLVPCSFEPMKVLHHHSLPTLHTLFVTESGSPLLRRRQLPLTMITWVIATIRQGRSSSGRRSSHYLYTMLRASNPPNDAEKTIIRRMRWIY